MIKKRAAGMFAIVAALLVILGGAQQSPLPRVTPETIGLSSARLNEATDGVDPARKR